jgi:hypothetical protein
MEEESGDGNTSKDEKPKSDKPAPEVECNSSYLIETWALSPIKQTTSQIKPNE